MKAEDATRAQIGKLNEDRDDWRKRLEAARERLNEAQSDAEREEAKLEFANARDGVQLNEDLIEATQEALAELTRRIPAAIENVRLHEETHLEVAREATKHANRALRRTKDPDVRRRIVAAAVAIEGDVQTLMDTRLNKFSLGSEEATSALQAWTGSRHVPPDRRDPEDFLSTLRRRFAEARQKDWVVEPPEMAEVGESKRAEE